MRPRVRTSARISVALSACISFNSTLSIVDFRWSPLSPVTMFPLQKVSFAKLPIVRRRLHPDRECLARRSKHRKLMTKFYFHVHPVFVSIFTAILFLFLFYVQTIYYNSLCTSSSPWFIKYNMEDINPSFKLLPSCYPELLNSKK